MVFPQPGDQIGRYRIDSVIGQDGLGVVYAATDERLQRTVAMHVLRPELAATPGFTDRFRESATRLSRLSSPYVAQVHDHATDGDHVYLVSQHVPEGTLAAWLQQHGALPQHAALTLAEQAAAGLADAHRQGLVHGDVGPHQVLVREAGTVRAHAWLTGFPLTDANPQASTTGDLQGVGRLLIAALTGTDPGPSPTPPPPGSFGPQVDALLNRLLGPHPEAGPPHADALRAELADMTRRWAPATPPPGAPGAPGAAPSSAAAPTATRPAAPPTAVRPAPLAPPPPPSSPPASDGKVRRNGLLVALVAAAVVLVVVAGGVAWRLLSDGGDGDGDGGGGGGGDPTTAAGVVTGDLDGDGRGDVLLDRLDPETLGKVGETVFLSSGEDGVGDPASEPYPDAVAIDTFPTLQLADVDGDQQLDKVFTASVDLALVIDVVPAEGEPWHQEIRTEGTDWGATDSFTALFGDVDRDGRDDLIIGNEFAAGGGVRLFVGSAGDDAFADPAEWYSSDSDADYAQFDVADFDGDGEDDVLATLEGDGPGEGEQPWDIELQLITSDGSALADAGAPLPFGPDNYTQGVRLYGDLDGDGDDEPLLVGPDGFATTEFADGAWSAIDLIWQAPPDNAAWQGRYNRYSSSATADWVMSDVDGDGDDDLVFLKYNGDPSKPVTVRMAEGGTLAEPVPWGTFDCAPSCGDSFSPVTPAY